MNKIIALTGPAGVGKSTIAKALANGPARALDPRPWRILSFAAPIKRMAAQILPAEELANKDEPSSLLGLTPREILQTLGTEWGRGLHRDFWTTLMVYELFREETPVIIDDLRFANEAELVRSLGGSVVRIVNRPGFDRTKAPTHSSEAGIPMALVDLNIMNVEPTEAAWGIAYNLRS
jgi:hypothetical protein